MWDHFFSVAISKQPVSFVDTGQVTTFCVLSVSDRGAKLEPHCWSSDDRTDASFDASRATESANQWSEPPAENQRNGYVSEFLGIPSGNLT